MAVKTQEELLLAINDGSLKSDGLVTPETLRTWLTDLVDTAEDRWGVGDLANSPAVSPQISAAIDAIEVYLADCPTGDVVSESVLVLRDTFTGANGTAIASHTPDENTGGNSWAGYRANFELLDGQADYVSSTGGGGNGEGIIINLGESPEEFTATMEASIGASGSFMQRGLHVRCDSAKTGGLCFFINRNGGASGASEFRSSLGIGGSTRQSVTLPNLSGDNPYTITLSADGDSITATLTIGGVDYTLTDTTTDRGFYFCPNGLQWGGQTAGNISQLCDAVEFTRPAIPVVNYTMDWTDLVAVLDVATALQYQGEDGTGTPWGNAFQLTTTDPNVYGRGFKLMNSVQNPVQSMKTGTSDANPIGIESFTVSIWARFTSMDVLTGTRTFWEARSGSSYMFRLGYDNTGIYLFCGAWNGSSYPVQETGFGTRPTNGRLFHFVITYDHTVGSFGEYKVYQDGALVLTTEPTRAVGFGPASLTFGGRSDTSSQDCAVGVGNGYDFTRVISASDIEALYYDGQGIVYRVDPQPGDVPAPAAPEGGCISPEDLRLAIAPTLDLIYPTE